MKQRFKIGDKVTLLRDTPFDSNYNFYGLKKTIARKGTIMKVLNVIRINNSPTFLDLIMASTTYPKYPKVRVKLHHHYVMKEEHYVE